MEDYIFNFSLVERLEMPALKLAFRVRQSIGILTHKRPVEFAKA